MQQINLYQEQFRSRRDPLGARTLALALGVLLILLAGISAWQRLELGDTAARAQAAEQRRDRIEREMMALRSQVEQAEAEDAVKAELPGRLRSELRAKRRLLEYLEGGPLARRGGFSTHLEGLARRVVEGLWLRRIVFERGGDRLQFEGHALEAGDVPRMMTALGEEEVYAGHAFRSLVIQRPEEEDWRVDFLLSSDLHSAEAESSGGGDSSRRRPYAEAFSQVMTGGAQ